CLRDGWADVLRGVISAEEARDIPAEPFNGTTIEAEPEASSERDAINAATPMPEPEPEPQPKRMTWGELLESFRLAIKDAGTADEIRHILRSPQMAECKAHIGRARIEHQRRYDEIMQLADERMTALDADAAEAALPDDMDAPEIKGEA